MWWSIFIELLNLRYSLLETGPYLVALSDGIIGLVPHESLHALIQQHPRKPGRCGAIH